MFMFRAIEKLTDTVGSGLDSLTKYCEIPKPKRLTAGFRNSYKEDTAYLFVKDECMLIDYRPCSSKDSVVRYLAKIDTWFPGLKGTVFGIYGIDCAFATHEDGKVYIFSSNYCALWDYGVSNSKIKKGPMLIADMFPCLKGTVFENGIDAAFEYSERYEVYLFKGEKSARMSYADNRLIEQGHIHELWPCLNRISIWPLSCTIFTGDIDAAFASHRHNNAYLFKGDYYVRLKFNPDGRNHEIPGGLMEIMGSFPNMARALGMTAPNLSFSALVDPMN